MTNLELFKALSYVSSDNLSGAEELQNTTHVRVSRKRPMKQAVLIAALIALWLLLMGCAIIYARWSSGLEDWFHPTDTIRQQAEQSGLSVIYPQDQNILLQALSS